MSSLKQKIVLVTGGASGIGYLLGMKSLQEGAKHLIIWDVDEEAMNSVRQEFTESGYSVSTQRVDVRNPESVKHAAEKVLDEFTTVDILFNNAGIVRGGQFHEQSQDDIRMVMDVNATGCMLVARAFLPGMLKKGAGHIINISSAASLTPNPGMAVYAASKWAATGWSESLRLEMKRSEADVHVLTVMPSYIDTGMFEGVKPPLLMPFLDPERITDKIIRAVKTNRVRLREPWLVKLTPFLRGILPGPVYDLVAGRIFKVYDSMTTFKGRDHV